MHIPVLLQEAINGLDLKPGDIFVDGTLGNGGHTGEICHRFGNAVAMIGIDLDQDAIERSKARLLKDCNVKYSQGSFRNIDKILDTLGMMKVDKILFDLGLSSNQLEESGRGFSFQKNEPLIMSFKKDLTENDLTGREVVNTWDEENIKTILESYGEERFASRIARAIVERRKNKPIETTFDLVEVVKSATPFFYHYLKIHPATKTFQALRIVVNDEIESLKEGMQKGFDRLNPNGRLAIISFHSLEDRLVKNFFKEKEESGAGSRITKKPIVPSEKELEDNPRSRSAKLRIIRKN